MIQKYRSLVQSLSLLLLHSSWGPELKWLCNPVLSCHSCVLSWFACPVGIFIHYSGYHAFPYIAVGVTVLVGVLVGRLLCGWVCPFGFLQDILYKIPTKKFVLPKWTSNIKYVLMILTVFLFPWFWGESSAGGFCNYCPSAALQVSVPYLIGGGTMSTATLTKLILTGGILLLAIVSQRSFCNVFCPIGAILAPFNLLSLWIVKLPPPTCLSCSLCDQACPTDVDPSRRIEQEIPANRTLDCIVCHECQPSCPQVEDEKPAAEGGRA